MRILTLKQWDLERVSLLMLLALAAIPVVAEIYPLQGSRMVGELYEIVVQPGEVGFKLARQHGVGFEEFAKANPHVNRHWVKPGERLVIPKQHILPGNLKRRGITVNVAEKRLYFYDPANGSLVTYPITVGREGWATPVMTTSVIEKMIDPEWRVPPSIKADALSKGIVLEDIVEPGPDNPLGQHALRLGRDNILIHGTNRPNDIGLRLSSGCIRMHPDDVKELFYRVPMGLTVEIIDEPYKAAVVDGMLYIESHMTMKEQWSLARRDNALRKALARVVPDHLIRAHFSEIRTFAFKHLGVPQPVVRVGPSTRPHEDAYTRARDYSASEKF